MTWKDILKEDRQKALDEFAKKIERTIEKILN